MGRKPRDKKPKYKEKYDMNVPGRIFESRKLKPPSLKSTSQYRGGTCEAYDCEIHKLIGLIADITTGVWRIKNKFSSINVDDLSDELKKACRHVESTWDALASAKVEVRDYTKEKYVPGMALNVIAFQPSSLVHLEMITDTIKPSIFFNSKLIQMGEVIVETPKKPESKQNDNMEDSHGDNEGNR